MKLIAHRGKDHHSFRENTKDALLTSLNMPYIDGIECDVRMTKDKKIVLHHDMTIQRTSDGSGFLKHKTLKELQKYNFGTKKNPTQITELTSFLSKVSTKKVIVLELKNEDIEVEDFVDRVVKICRKYPLNYYFCSFRYEILTYMKEKYPTLKVGIIVGNGINEHHMNEFDFISINKRDYTASKKELFVWTINSEKEIEKFKQKEVYIVTDKAYLLKDSGK